MSPHAHICWPYFTIEAKGPMQGVDVAILQNAYNGAIMLKNMLKLKREVNKEDDLLGKIQVITLDLTTETLSLHGHWAIRNRIGGLEYRSILLAAQSV